MRLVIGLLVFLSLAADGLAATVHVTPRTSSRSSRLALSPRAVDRSVMQAGVPHAVAGAARAVTVLNCENDNVIDPSSTLRLLPGDSAGNIFEIGAQTAPRLVDSVSIGLLPQASSTAPLLLYLDIYVYDPQDDSFAIVAPFDVTIDSAIDPDGEIIDVDLSSFGVEVDHDVLTLCSDQTNAGIDDMVNPAGDASPRCLDASGSNVCSVLLPFDGDSLLIYGIDDEQCPSGILNFDLVHEIVLAPVVATEPSTWGSIKARF